MISSCMRENGNAYGKLNKIWLLKSKKGVFGKATYNVCLFHHQSAKLMVAVGNVIPVLTNHLITFKMLDLDVYAGSPKF